jgi:hypothetical protein
MASSGMSRRVALVRTDVSEELSASFIKVTRIGELVTTLGLVFLRSVRRLPVTAIVPSSPILVTLIKEALSSSETSVLTIPSWYFFAACVGCLLQLTLFLVHRFLSP